MSDLYLHAKKIRGVFFRGENPRYPLAFNLRRDRFMGLDKVFLVSSKEQASDLVKSIQNLESESSEDKTLIKELMLSLGVAYENFLKTHDEIIQEASRVMIYGTPPMKHREELKILMSSPYWLVNVLLRECGAWRVPMIGQRILKVLEDSKDKPAAFSFLRAEINNQINV